MRAMVLEDPRPVHEGPLVLREGPDPVPGPGDILLAVEACGVCRTDLQICEGDIAPRRRPVVPGHQVVGTVVSRGPGVTAPAVGDRVGAVWIAGACGACRFCASGRENLCTTAEFTGWDRDGGFADRMTMRADFAITLPPGSAPVDAAPLLCGGAIGHRALTLTGAGAGDHLGLAGFGASALLTIQVAVHRGIRVSVFTRSEEERARARALGAVWAGGYADAPPAPLDAAITFAPVGRVVTDTLRHLDRGGTLVVNAIHLDEVPAFPYEDLWWERTLRSVANVTRADAIGFMDLAARIPVRTAVRPYPLERANDALADLAAGRVGGAAVLVIDPAGPS